MSLDWVRPKGLVSISTIGVVTSGGFFNSQVYTFSAPVTPVSSPGSGDSSAGSVACCWSDEGSGNAAVSWGSVALPQGHVADTKLQPIIWSSASGGLGDISMVAFIVSCLLGSLISLVWVPSVAW